MIFSVASVIIDNLNAGWAGFILQPFKADPPLVIDPNGILALAVSLHGFQLVGIERSKVAQGSGRV
jgi:hypothetical protein